MRNLLEGVGNSVWLQPEDKDDIVALFGPFPGVWLDR